MFMKSANAACLITINAHSNWYLPRLLVPNRCGASPPASLPSLLPAVLTLHLGHRSWTLPPLHQLAAAANLAPAPTSPAPKRLSCDSHSRNGRHEWYRRGHHANLQNNEDRANCA